METKRLRVSVEGKSYEVLVEMLDEAQASPAQSSAPAVPAGGQEVRSPLSGVVKEIDVSVGDAVADGSKVMTLEAMKMFTAINAEQAGTISSVAVKIGDSVDEGQVLYYLS